MATVYKRGKIWWGRVQREGRELRESLETTSEAVARKRLQAWLERIGEAKWGGKVRRTYDEAMEEFLTKHVATLKPSSADRYFCSARRLTDHFEGLYLDQITSAAMSGFEAKRRKEGAVVPDRLVGRQRPRSIKPATIRRDLACLSSMFGYAMEIEWAPFNPVPAYLKARRKRGLKESDPRTRWLTHDEEAALLHACQFRPDGKPIKHGRALADIVAVAIDTGLRSNELFSLRRPMVNKARNQIEIPAALAKNGKARDVPLLPRAAAIVGTIPAQLKTDFVFVNRKTGERYTILLKGLKGAALRAGIRPLTWHDLRRTCGCRLLQDHGMPLEKVSRWLGHSDTKVTEKRYAFLRTEDLHAAVQSHNSGHIGIVDSQRKADNIK